MPHLEWRSELDTGIELIDDQHRRIIDYINQLEDVIEGGDHAQTADLIDELFDYTDTHFQFEETLQERAGYELINAHKHLHRRFIRRLTEYQSRFEKGEEHVAVELHDMLQKWLINHILHDDADYVPDVLQIMGGGEKRQSWLGSRFKKMLGSG